MVDALKQYKDLLDAGLITEEEYEAKKQELMASDAQAEAPVQPQGFQPMQPVQPVQPTPAPQPVQPQGFQQPQQGFQSPYQGQSYQAPQHSNPVPGYVPAKRAKSKVVAGVLGILLNGLGVHKFYLGYTKEGLIMLLVTLFTSMFGVGLIMSIIGFIEGILYLTKSDADFDRIYVKGHKGWF